MTILLLQPKQLVTIRQQAMERNQLNRLIQEKELPTNHAKDGRRTAN